MSDLPGLLATGGFGAAVLSAFIALLRTNVMQQRLFAEHMKDMLEATKAGARADYAVAAALQRIEHRMGLPPSNAGSQPDPSTGQGGVS
jgi:hypothetical protein